MSLARLRPELQRTLAMAVPSLVLLLALLLVVPRAVGIWVVSQQITARRQAVALRNRQNLLEAAARRRLPLPAPPQCRDEQLLFLNQLARIVAASHVHLAAYRPPEIEVGAAPAADPPVSGSAPLKPIATDVTVSGSFPHLVSLFQGLASADRLFVVETLKVRTDSYPRLSAAFCLVRYVTPVHLAAASPEQRPSF